MQMYAPDNMLDRQAMFGGKRRDTQPTYAAESLSQVVHSYACDLTAANTSKNVKVTQVQ